ncbi:MAG: phenol hydroxylase subunit [Chloroflexi bacterium]|jgi:phenol hydroxylase P4 protein|nr:phenol hydroxylase subunit [Chloroflexota bacterium]
MSVVSLKPGYEFPARDRAELFGNDMLVYTHWVGNLMFSAAAAFRVPQGMPWGDFKANMLDGLFGGDAPAYRQLTPENTRWTLNDQEFSPANDRSLADLGITHKDLIKFEQVS